MIKRGHEFLDIFGREWIVDSYDDTDGLYLCELKNHNNVVGYFNGETIEKRNEILSPIDKM